MADLSRESSYKTPLANSPLLPMLLASLVLQKNSPTNTKTANSIFREYDYVIVGAGSAGATLAARLSEVPCINVLLLEAGKSPPLLTEVPAFAAVFSGSDIDWKFKTEPLKYTARLQKNQQIVMPAGTALGGSSSINYQIFVRGNKKNFDDWEAQGATGWSFKDVLPYFKKLEDNKNSNYTQNGYHGVGGPVTIEDLAYNSELQKSLLEAALDIGYDMTDINGPQQSGYSNLQGNTRNHQRCGTAKAYLVPAENRENLHILPEAFVTKVIIENKQAIGVEFEVNGTKHNVKVRKEVIMSAGTINTAKLLMLSGIGPGQELKKHKIPVVIDLPVGKNLQNHCGTLNSFELDSRIEPLQKKAKDEITVNKYIDTRKGFLTTLAYFWANAFVNDYGNPPIDFPKNQLFFAEGDVQMFKDNGVTDEAFDKIYKPYENKPMYICLAIMTQPKVRGYVKLRSSDPKDPPIVNPDYLADPEDVKIVVEGMRACHQLGTHKRMQQVGSKPFNTTIPGCEEEASKYGMHSDQYFECHARSITFSIAHQVGTAKMGNPSDQTTVVNPELKVKGIKGLRIVDASVMPIIPSGNTNIPTIMVAEKAADIIKGSIQC